MSFDEIFDALLIPRENGTPALQQIAAWLETVGRATGADVTVHHFACHPYIHRIAGVVALLLAMLFLAAMWRRRFVLALGVALLLPTYLALEFEFYVPVLSGLFAVPEHNLLLSFPVAGATRTVVLGAHYDTKTDLLDHYQRAPIQFLVLPVALVTIGVAVSGWRRLRHGTSVRGVQIAAAAASAYYLTLAVTLSGGALVTARSPGALDDAAAVAVLLKVAEALGNSEVKLNHTNVTIALFAGEEVGVQGSWSYLRDHPNAGSAQPVYFINAEALGIGQEIRYFTSDRSSLHRYDAAGTLMRTLDRASRKASGRGLVPDSRPVVTDARSFMAAGIPSVCLTSSRGQDDDVRGLHSARDSRDRIDIPSLQRTLKFYLAALEEVDQGV